MLKCQASAAQFANVSWLHSLNLDNKQQKWIMATLGKKEIHQRNTQDLTGLQGGREKDVEGQGDRDGNRSSLSSMNCWVAPCLEWRHWPSFSAPFQSRFRIPGKGLVRQAWHVAAPCSYCSCLLGPSQWRGTHPVASFVNAKKERKKKEKENRVKEKQKEGRKEGRKKRKPDQNKKRKKKETEKQP